MFCLSKEVVHIAIEYQPAHDAERQNFLRDNLGGVQNVEIEVVCKLLVEELKTEFPLRKIAVVNCMPQIPAVKVRIGS